MTDIETVWLLTADTDPDNRLLASGEVQTLLDLEGGSIKRAAAAALETIARSEVLVSKVIKSQNLSTDGAKVAAELRASAAELRRQAEQDAEDESGGFFDIVDFDPHQWPPELAEG